MFKYIRCNDEERIKKEFDDVAWNQINKTIDELQERIAALEKLTPNVSKPNFESLLEIQGCHHIDSISEEMKMVREKLAEQVHIQWSGWMEYLFKQGTFKTNGTWCMNKWAVERWTRQKDTPYQELTDSEKLSDLNEADKFLSLIEKCTKDK